MAPTKPNICAVCFNSVNGPCLMLDKTGLVVMAVAAGPATFRRVSCAQKVEHHYHFVGSDFIVARGSKTYFGDVAFDWDDDRSFKPSALFGALGAMADQSSNDGTITMRVNDSEEGTVAAYRDLVHGNDDLPLARSLVAVGH